MAIDTRFQRLAGGLAFAVAIGGLAYSAAFVIALRTDSQPALQLSYLLLLLGGLVATAVFVALYRLAQATDAGLALWGLLLGAVGTLGSAIHGGFDLGVSIEPGTAARGPLPNAVDPRGLLTFGVTGLALLVLVIAIRRGRSLPQGLGIVLGSLMILIYLGRLLIVDPNNLLLLGVAAVTGVVVHPVWFVLLGRALRRSAG